MESFKLKTYLLYAIYIVRTNPGILLFLTVFGLYDAYAFTLLGDNVTNNFNGRTIVATFFISPVIFGMYYEIVENKYTDIMSIFRTYVPGYILVLLCMYIPITIATAMMLSLIAGGSGTGVVMITALIFSMVFLYVIPTFYISGKVIDSIIFGVRFFFANLANSAPLLLMALFSQVLLFLGFQLMPLKEAHPALFVLLHCLMYLIASIVDFLLFIMLIYVLRNQNIARR